MNLPNPFNDSAVAHPAAADEAAASINPPSHDAAADYRFVLDVESFLKRIAPDIEPDPLPLFLAAPSQAYLRATDLIPVLEVLAGGAA